MSGKSAIKHDIALAAVLCAMLAAGSFFDREISQALYMPLNVPFLIITVAGQYVFFSAFIFFAGVLLRQASVCGTISGKKKQFYKIACAYLSLSTGMIGSAAVLHYECIGAFFPDTEFSLLFVFIFSMLFMYPLMFVGFAVGPRKYDSSLVELLIRMLVLITVGTSFIGLLKLFLARPRFRYTVAGYDGVGFTPWYMPIQNAGDLMTMHGMDINCFQSLPSGHALMGMSSIYIFPVLARIFPGLKNKETTLRITGLIYGLAVMLSRIVLGAHYLSDVAIGALLSLLFGNAVLRFRCGNIVNNRKNKSK